WHPAEKEQFGVQQHDAWRTIQRSHAIANGVFVVSINRIGLEKPNAESPGIEFWGGSFICDPFGVVLAEASSDQEEILYAEIDPSRIEDVRRNWPFLRDRRIDVFGDLAKRFSD
ncbi:acyltransferase, partial [bacterium]|nr:acyltransferase [bacterium]